MASTQLTAKSLQRRSHKKSAAHVSASTLTQNDHRNAPQYHRLLSIFVILISASVGHATLHKAASSNHIVQLLAAPDSAMSAD